MPQFELSIPKHTTFQVSNGKTNLYQCQQDVQLKISETALLVKLKQDFFVVSLDPIRTLDNFARVMYACNNTNVYQVRDMANLESDKYDVTTCFNNVVVACRNFRICSQDSYYVWKVTSDVDGDPIYTQHGNLDLTQWHEILTELPKSELQTSCPEYKLHIRRDTAVTFGNTSYTMCHDLCLVTNCRIVSSHAPLCFGQSESEVCANPFESAKITDSQVMMQTLDGYWFEVPIETFRRNITQCQFSTDRDIYYYSSNGYTCIVSDFAWQREQAHKYYQIYTVIQKSNLKK